MTIFLLSVALNFCNAIQTDVTCITTKSVMDMRLVIGVISLPTAKVNVLLEYIKL